MTDREKMIEVIDNWNVDNDFPLRAIDLGAIADRLIDAGFGMVKKAQPKKTYWLKYDDGKYLVKGSFNGKPFDGNGQPYKFNEKDAKEISETLNFEMEQAPGNPNE